MSTGDVPPPSQPSQPLIRFLKHRRRLRASAFQVISVVIGLGLALALTSITSGSQLSSTDVRGFLFSMGAAVIALITVVFSLLFVVIQWGSTAFTPRLTLFRDDPIVWRTSGMFVGLFVFYTTSGLAIGQQASVAIPIVAVLLALVGLVLIRTLLVAAYRSIQLWAVLDEIDVRGRRIIDAIFDRIDPLRAVPSSVKPDQWGHQTIVWRDRPVVLQEIDLHQLMAAARSVDGYIELAIGVGETIQELAAVAVIVAPQGPPVAEGTILKALRTGAVRTFDQDTTLAFRLLVDIALRSGSSAINDQASVVECLTRLDGLLCHLALLDLRIGEIVDADGVVRIKCIIPTWAGFLAAAYDELEPMIDASPTLRTAHEAGLRHLLGLVDDSREDPVKERLARINRLEKEG
jgi:uncharacterized membrane protein